MCNACIIFTYDEVLDITHKLEVNAPLAVDPDWPARKPNAHPKAVASLVVPAFDTAQEPQTLGAGSLAVKELVWGFEESWSPQVVFNTRIESAAKPLWRDSMEHRRCVLPVRAFFETHEQETYPSPKTGRLIKRPYQFRVPGEDIILLGATYEEGRFSLVTTEANASMAPIHHRMPLVIRPEELPLWLSNGYQRLADRSTILLDAEPLGETPLTLF